MPNGKAKSVAVGALVLLLICGGAVAVGYYVLYGDEPSSVAPPKSQQAAAQNPGANFGYNWSGSPQSRPTYDGPPVTGIVLAADGRPAAGATVTYGWERVYASVNLNPTNPGAAPVRTGADGRFTLTPRNGKPESIAVQSDEGIGMAKASSLPDTPIRIQRWGRVEGIAKVGKNPAPNARVGLRFNTRTPDGPLVYVSGSNQTDLEGRFAFEKAPPGLVDIDVTPSGQQRSMVRAQVEVQSGSTATVAVGGTGRPVIGRVSPMPANSAGYASLMVAPPRPPRPPQFLSAATTMPAEERQKLIAEYRQSPEYQAYLKERDAFMSRRGQMAQPSQPAQATIDSDGRFRIEDVPAGVYQLNVSLHDAQPGASMRLESVGFANTSVTVSDMPGGRSDEPLDVGELKLTIQKRMNIGDTVPDLAGATADGKPAKLTDFRGKYLLLGISRYRFSTGLANGMTNMVSCLAVHDRYRDDPRLALLTMGPRTGAILNSERAKPLGTVDWPVIEVQSAIPEEFTNSESILLLDPQGKLLAKNLTAPAAVAKIEEVLGPPANGTRPGVKVAVAHLPPEAPEGTPYGTVPPASATDAATTAVFSVVDGTGVTPPDSVDRLKDGHDSTGDDAPTQAFFFELGTLEGRLKVDLGRTISVAQVNTYSRHRADRAPQVYNLYASNGTSSGFDPSPKLGVDPASVGWTKIAVVDTRAKTGPAGGRYAVSLSGSSGSLGRYRYLLFEIFPSETRDPYGQAFYSEIDVVEAR